MPANEQARANPTEVARSQPKSVAPEVGADRGQQEEPEREDDAHRLERGHQVEDRQGQDPEMRQSAPAADRPVEDRIEGFEQDAPVERAEDEEGQPARPGGQPEVGGPDPEDVAEEEVLEVEPGRQPAQERDAGSEEDDEERAEGRVLLEPGQRG